MDDVKKNFGERPHPWPINCRHIRGGGPNNASREIGTNGNVLIA